MADSQERENARQASESARMRAKRERREERGAAEAQHVERNRILVGLPERLNKASTALRDAEKLIENLKSVYAHRSILKDEVILDEIGDLLGERQT